MPSVVFLRIDIVLTLLRKKERQVTIYTKKKSAQATRYIESGIWPGGRVCGDVGHLINIGEPNILVTTAGRAGTKKIP